MNVFNVKTLYIYKFIGSCLPIYAFYQILFLERGQSVSDIAVLLALWSFFAIIFEFPSGVLADRWNRRNMLAIAKLIKGFCFVIWFFSHSFLMFALGFAVWAVASAFSSGTEEGLIYDNLKSDGDVESFTKVYGRAQFWANVGSFTGIASAGVLVNYVSIENMSLISAGICFLNFFFAMRLREKNFYSERLKNEQMVDTADYSDGAAHGLFKSFFGTFMEASIFIKSSRVALVSILFLILFSSLGGYLDEFDAFIINDFGINLVWVSVILTVRNVFVALGDLLAPKVQKWISSVERIFLFGIVSFILLIVFAVVWNQYLIPIFGLTFMILTITEILFINVLQGEIKEEGRATVMSFFSAGQNVAMICLSLIYGLLAGIFTLQQVYSIISLYGIAGCVVFYIIWKVMKKKIVM